MYDDEEEDDEECDVDVSGAVAAGTLYLGLKAGGKKEDDYAPYNTHWETNFDWMDEGNDGYDDRDDGCWTPSF